MSDISKHIEGILFLHGEPIHARNIAKIIGIKEADITAELLELQKKYADNGVHLIEHDKEWQFVTAPEISKTIQELTKSEYSQNLSRAALETLAVVAYKGPLTRADIEFIRGVNSVYSLRNLLMRGLIKKKDNPIDGRSHIYSVTFDFMHYFGMEKISNLPRYEEFRTAEILIPEKEPRA